MNIDIALLATPLVILALVNLAKKFGVEGRWSMLLAVVLGVALAVADGLLAGNQVYHLASDGLLIGLSAAGLYDLAGRVQMGPQGEKGEPGPEGLRGVQGEPGESAKPDSVFL